jgi:hypothetical protein
MRLIAAALCACAPALDWRQVKPLELGAEALFPCRPASHARDIALLDQRVEMVMWACSAGGATFALSSLQLNDVRDVGGVLHSLRAAAARNVGAGDMAMEPFDVPGMTPNAQSGRSALVGRRPDGSAVAEDVLLFSRGARVYQASVVASSRDPATVNTFYAGLKVLP